jgi:hypothetical protein
MTQDQTPQAGAAFDLQPESSPPISQPTSVDSLTPEQVAQIVQQATSQPQAPLQTVPAVPLPTPIPAPTQITARASVARPVISIGNDDTDEWISVSLVGKSYLCRRPKMLATIEQYIGIDLDNLKDMAEVWGVVNNLVADMIHPSSQAEVLARLHDPNDRIDIVHLSSLRKILSTWGLEQVPTT